MEKQRTGEDYSSKNNITTEDEKNDQTFCHEFKTLNGNMYW